MVPPSPFGHFPHGGRDIRAASARVVPGVRAAKARVVLGVRAARARVVLGVRAARARVVLGARPPVGGLQGGTMSHKHYIRR